jgi:lysophospholipase L1-like esterase
MNQEESHAASKRKGAGPSRRLALRIGLAAVSLIVVAICLEGVLQIAAVIVGGTGRINDLASERGAVRVLCIGDSNTWGLYVHPHESWPAQLESRWAKIDSRPIQVVNMGYPGVNSSRVRADLTRAIDEVRPDVAIVMVGANDHWITSVEQNESGRSSMLRFLKDESRVYKLAYMLWRTTVGWSSGDDPRIQDGRFDIGGNRPNPREPMLDNLNEIVRHAREANTTLVLMTYPAQEARTYYPFASKLIRQVAKETETPLIDLYRLFKSHCPTKHCGRLLYKDGHANAKGYEIIADEVARQLHLLFQNQAED